MADDAFDIGPLVPRDSRHIKLEIRLSTSSVVLQILDAEDPAAAQGGLLARAVLWREPGRSVVISVPVDVKFCIIYARYETFFSGLRKSCPVE
jgi:hypothetical protein